MERIDDLQVNNLRLIQNDEYFCFGCDAVELANFVTGTAKDRAVDLGSGTGVIPMLLAGKKAIPTTAVEIDPYLASLCQRNAELNNLTGMVDVINAPMQTLKTVMKGGSRSIVVSNPPYFRAGSGPARKDALAGASHELTVTLREVAECAAHLLAAGGRFYVVYPALRLAELISECRLLRLEPKELVLLHAPNKSPHIFMLKCVKDGKVGIKIDCREVRTYC